MDMLGVLRKYKVQQIKSKQCKNRKFAVSIIMGFPKTLINITKPQHSQIVTMLPALEVVFSP